MKVTRVDKSVELQTLSLIRTMFTSSSRTQHFYSHLLDQHMNNESVCKKNLVYRAINICNKYNISFTQTLCDEKYVRGKNIFNQFTENDGIIDTVRYLARNLDNNNRHLINLILSPY